MNIVKLETLLKYIGEMQVILSESDGVEVQILCNINKLRDSVAGELKALVWARYLRGEG